MSIKNVDLFSLTITNISMDHHLTKIAKEVKRLIFTNYDFIMEYRGWCQIAMKRFSGDLYSLLRLSDVTKSLLRHPTFVSSRKLVIS